MLDGVCQIVVCMQCDNEWKGSEMLVMVKEFVFFCVLCVKQFVVFEVFYFDFFGVSFLVFCYVMEFVEGMIDVRFQVIEMVVEQMVEFFQCLYCFDVDDVVLFMLFVLEDLWIEVFQYLWDECLIQ